MLRGAAIAVALFLLPSPLAGQTEQRIALLIGNQGYNAKIGALKNPHADIALVGAALRSLAFKVTEVKDANYRALDTAIKRHIQAARRAGQGAISFVYYSGHGAADPETKINYLIPVDIPSADDDSLWINSLNLNNVVENLREQAPAATHYVVFDACRNELNVMRTGQKALVEKGFVPLAYTPGVMIAYATAPGRTASDTGLGSGPYARALSEEIVKPGAEALYMFRRVALRVNREIGQDPWISASTLPEVYFAGRKPEGPTPEQQLEMAFWASVKDNTDPAVLRSYVERYPNGTFAAAAIALAEQREKRLEAEAAAREEARKAAELQRKESERRAKEARLAEERRRAEEARNSAEAKRLEEQQRLEALAQAEELRKAREELQAAKDAAKAAEEQREAAVKTAEAAERAAKAAMAKKSELRKGMRPLARPDVQAGGLFTEKDTQRVRSHAERHQLNVPDFQFEVPDKDTPATYRRFIGVWIDQSPVGRRLMMIITRVSRDGSAQGLWVFGPPAPTSVTKDPAGAWTISGQISGDTLRFRNPRGDGHYKHVLARGNRINYVWSGTEGRTASAPFVPLWTLVEAERVAKQ